MKKTKGFNRYILQEYQSRVVISVKNGNFHIEGSKYILTQYPKRASQLLLITY